ncbi:hypothetical protein EJB05_51555 [Eragrostis curvula]|uniref:Uncharacterized protein n=1 Tax=Eragrostis curvula TaxID=38414 RepID=A0A5J9SVI2_9POAL|nr:hypothetical protein EJB05_51555 [Eragrostis curvula]
MDASSSTTSTLSGSMAVNSSFCSYRSPDRFSLSWCGGADAEREAMLMRAAFEGNLLLLKGRDQFQLLLRAGTNMGTMSFQLATLCTYVADKRNCELKRAKLKSQAKVAFMNKDYLSALTLYTSALGTGTSSDDDDVADLLANRSLCWLHLEDGENALTDANASRVLRPCWPKACYRQGSALMLLKDYGRACQLFAEGLKMDPTDVEIQNALREALDLSKKACHSEQEQ